MKFTRTITTTTVHAVAPVKTEKGIELIELPPVTVMNAVNERQLLKAVRKTTGEKNAMIATTEEQSAIYECSIEDFMKIAKVKESK